jgi:hypothetical protein
MRLRSTFLALAFVALASVASAQTHICDAAPTLNPSYTSPIVVQMCHSNKDVNGAPVVITSWEVTIDAVVAFAGPLSPVGLVSPGGMTLYETAPLVPPSISPPVGNVGPHTISVKVTAVAGPSLPSTIYPFTIVIPLPPPTPSKPTVVGIRK